MPHHIIRSRIVEGVKPYQLVAALMKREKLGALPLAKRMGKPALQPQIHRFINGGVAAPKQTTAAPLAAYFGIPLEAIYDERAATEAARALGIGDDGSHLESGGSPATSAPAARPDDAMLVRNVRPVYVVGKCQGGFPERIWDDSGRLAEQSDEYALVSTTDPLAFVTEVCGGSMAPRYRDREFALVEPSTTPEIEDDVIVRLKGGETMLKRLLGRRYGIRLGSYADAEVIELDEDDVLWMYYVAHPIPRRKIFTRAEQVYSGPLPDRRATKQAVPVLRDREAWHYDTEGKDYPPGVELEDDEDEDDDAGQARLA